MVLHVFSVFPRDLFLPSSPSSSISVMHFLISAGKSKRGVPLPSRSVSTEGTQSWFRPSSTVWRSRQRQTVCCLSISRPFLTTCRRLPKRRLTILRPPLRRSFCGHHHHHHHRWLRPSVPCLSHRTDRIVMGYNFFCRSRLSRETSFLSGCCPTLSTQTFLRPIHIMTPT